MKRSTPLRRSKGVRKRRATPRKSSRVHDADYMDRVRGLPCLVAEMLPEAYAVHDAEMNAHHMGARGLGQKCSDMETVPLCFSCHAAWHDCTGPFRGKSKEWRREFARAAIEATRAVVLPMLKREAEE